MLVLLSAVFVASLLGSLHCVGMCGPFAMLASASDGERKSAILPAAAYSLGRLATYAIVGVIFGLLGMAVNRGTSQIGGVMFSSVQQTATLGAGLLMICVGLIALARQLGWRLTLPRFTTGLQSVLQRLFQRVRQLPRFRKAFLIGALTCLMPCGWLYTFAIVAAGTGSPVSGAVVMVFFWLGTVPIMVALILGMGRLGKTVQQKVPLAMAIIVILIGCFTVAWRAPIAASTQTMVANGSDELIRQVQTIDQSELPCCNHPQ